MTQQNPPSEKPVTADKPGSTSLQIEKSEQGRNIAEYKPDWLEKLPWPLKTTGIVVPLGILIYVSFCSTLIEKPVEFFVTVLLTYVALLVVITQAYISKRQWFAMRATLSVTEEQIRLSRDGLIETRRQVVIAENSLKHSEMMYSVGERPYLRLKRINCLRKLDLNIPLIVQMEVHNVGRGAATELVGVSKGFISNQHPQKFIDTYAPEIVKDDITERISVVAPGTDYEFRTQKIFSAEELTRDIFLGLAAQQLNLFIAGEVRYKDFNGGEYSMPFLAIYDLDNNEIFEIDWERKGTYWEHAKL